MAGAEQTMRFTNRPGRMTDNRSRAASLDIGSGPVEGAAVHLLGAREEGPGMRWGALQPAA